MTSHSHPLSRLDIRRYHDRPTNSVCLKYVGHRLSFHDLVYGFPNGVFFVASIDEMPYPPKLVQVSEATGVPIEVTDVGRSIKTAAVDALVAEALVKAPSLLTEFAEPKTHWASWDHRELERQHVIAVARLVELTGIGERELRLRAAKVSFDPGLGQILPPAPPLPMLGYRLPQPPVPLIIEAGPCEDDIEETEEVETVVEVPMTPTQSLVMRVTGAIRAAREAELPQRLPGGARRALTKLVRSAYVIRGDETPTARGDILEAMLDGEKMAASSKAEVTVVDWDGEWPVVVRRYGEGGRTVYRVEEALRRAGVEEKAA